MEIQADSLKLVCPRCGSEELIIESDTIKKERIRSHTVLESQRIQNETEEKKLEGKKSDIVFELNKLTHEEKVKDKKYKQDVKEVKIGIIIFISFIALCFAVVGIYFGIIKIQGKIKMPLSSEECIGANSDFIAMQLQDIGFSNIEMKPLGDLKKADSQEGIIYQIMIDGNIDFEDGHYWLPNSKIIIYYHSAP